MASINDTVAAAAAGNDTLLGMKRDNIPRRDSVGYVVHDAASRQLAHPTRLEDARNFLPLASR